jgi:hypothetical protein
MKEKNEFRNGFIVGVVVSLLMMAFYNTASADDQFVVLNTEPLVEGAPQLRYTIINTETGKCYDYVPSTPLHAMELEEAVCPL